MARRDALLRLQNTLLARRAYLEKILAGELANLRDFRTADSARDSADVAFETSNDEMSSHLAEFDARELNQIELALGRLKKGTYGTCSGGSENCQIKIPLARLKALAYTTFCIHCEREIEKHPDWQDRGSVGNWEKVFNSEAPLEDQRINLSVMEMA
jgi:DnaK suppressor protein